MLAVVLMAGTVGCGDDSSTGSTQTKQAEVTPEAKQATEAATEAPAEEKKEDVAEPEKNEEKASDDTKAEEKKESGAKDETKDDSKKKESSEKKEGSSKSNGSKLVGKWKCEFPLDDKTTLTAIYVFKEDGTGTYDLEGGVTKFTYKDNGKTLTIKFKSADGDMKLKYTLKGDKFSYKDISGNKVEFIRQ